MKMFIISIALIFFSTNSFADNLNNIWSDLLKENDFDESKQSFCLKDLDNNTNQRNDQLVRPASVTKLYVTTWALDRLGKDFRFQTKFHVKNKSLYIEGGQDSYLTSEILFAVMNKLSHMGYSKFQNVYFDKSFYFNWEDDHNQIRVKLSKYLNTSSWSQSIKNEYEQARINSTQLSPHIQLDQKLNFQATSIKFSTAPLDINESDLTLAFNSSPLTDHLKQMNIYSTNFIAQKLYDFMGGNEEFHNYMKNVFSASSNEILFETGSGLGENLTTCNLTLRLLDHLNLIIGRESINLKNIISVAGVDLGTLRNRFKDPFMNKTVIAKTGTLRHTVTLAGFIQTINGTASFAIFNHTYELDKARAMQDTFVRSFYDHISEREYLEYNQTDYIPLVNSTLVEI